MDQRASGGQKRARAEGSHNEGDWTCPQCGNVNFAFRTNCNLQKCLTPRPSYPLQRTVPGNQPMYEQMTPPFYTGSAGAALVHIPAGITSYGVAMGVPAAGIPYGFNGPMTVNQSFGAMGMQEPYGAPPSLGGGGLGYGGPGMEDLYGMNYGMGRGLMLPGPGAGLYMEENGSRKRRGETSEGEWTCPKCGNTNFAFRTVCNMRKCRTPKPTAESFRGQGKFLLATADGQANGSWTCNQCGNVNYSFRTKCNWKNCGAVKQPDEKHQP